MGQISRMNRAERFVTEFGPDLAAAVAETEPGEMLTVRKVFAASRGATHEVVLHYAMSDIDGEEVVLEDGCVLFDPEEQVDVERLAGMLGRPEAEIAERVTRADL